VMFVLATMLGSLRKRRIGPNYSKDLVHSQKFSNSRAFDFS